MHFESVVNFSTVADVSTACLIGTYLAACPESAGHTPLLYLCQPYTPPLPHTHARFSVLLFLSFSSLHFLSAPGLYITSLSDLLTTPSEATCAM